MTKSTNVILCLVLAGCVEAGDGPLRGDDATTEQELLACPTTPIASRDCTNPQGQTGFMGGFALICGVTIPAQTNCVYNNGTRYNVGTEANCASCYKAGVPWTTIRSTWHLHDPVATDAQMLSSPPAVFCSNGGSGPLWDCAFYDRTFTFTGTNAGYFPSPSQGIFTLDSYLQYMRVNTTAGTVTHYTPNNIHGTGPWSATGSNVLNTTANWGGGIPPTVTAYSGLQIYPDLIPNVMHIWAGRDWRFEKQ